MESIKQMEGSTGGSALSPLPLGGRRSRRGRRSTGKKLRLVKKSTVRRMLKKQGLRMRGGDPVFPDAPAPESSGGRRRRKH